MDALTFNKQLYERFATFHIKGHSILWQHFNICFIIIIIIIQRFIRIILEGKRFL